MGSSIGQFRELDFRGKENWRRRTELINYCVEITNETRTGRPDQLGDGAHPSSSLGVSDEAKVTEITNRSPCHP